MSEATQQHILTASLSDVGMVRTHNEDYCGQFSKKDGCLLLVTADGMGGHRGGATASRTAVETIGEVFQQSTESSEAMLHEAIAAANQRVHCKAIEDSELRGMGTTVVALLLAPDGGGWIAHVGDSRCYRLRNGHMEALTADHSVVGEMLRQGLITAEEAEIHPRRHEITRSVGVEPQVQAKISQISVQQGDRFLLCSDGLTGPLGEEDIALAMVNETPAEAARVLIEEANARGGSDNITVQIAAIGTRERTGDRREELTTEKAGGGNGSSTNEAGVAAGERRRRARRIAALAALVAGLLAAALLALLFTGALTVESQGKGGTVGSTPSGPDRIE